MRNSRTVLSFFTKGAIITDRTFFVRNITWLSPYHLFQSHTVNQPKKYFDHIENDLFHFLFFKAPKKRTALSAYDSISDLRLLPINAEIASAGDLPSYSTA